MICLKTTVLKYRSAECFCQLFAMPFGKNNTCFPQATTHFKTLFSYSNHLMWRPASAMDCVLVDIY